MLGIQKIMVKFLLKLLTVVVWFISLMVSSTGMAVHQPDHQPYFGARLIINQIELSLKARTGFT